jgi:GTP-binding protein HflX
MQFDSKAIDEHNEVPLPDEGRFEELVQQWQQIGDRGASPGQDRSYVVSVAVDREIPSSAAHEEILGLVRAQGDAIVGHEYAKLARPDPRSLFRRGRAQEIADRAKQCGANLLIVNAELSPSQSRNLEDATGLQVRDREAVILNVFQRQVKTRKARIQVEIAHLQYLRPRIRGLGLEMDQQAGGVVGSRGPGETASELLARQLDGRLAQLRKSFADVCRDSDVQRQGRSACRKIALVGYTNAGKSSIMNALTHANLSAANRPFETLDTTSRCLTRHGGDLLLSDTVGFIRNLPSRLLASFESTLAEIQEASLLAVVLDAADPEALLHLQTTSEMLHKLKAQDIPRLYVLNKIDLLPGPLEDTPLWHQLRHHRYVSCSCLDPKSVEALREALLAAGRQGQVRTRVFVPYSATRATALVYSKCRVMRAAPGDSGIEFTVEAEARWIKRIEHEIRSAERPA